MISPLLGIKNKGNISKSPKCGVSAALMACAYVNQHPATLHSWNGCCCGLGTNGNRVEYKTGEQECWVLSVPEQAGDNASLHRPVSIVPGLSWVESRGEEEKGLHSAPDGASSNLPLSSRLLSPSQCFPFSLGLIDTPVLQRYVTQRSSESPRLLARLLSFCLPASPIRHCSNPPVLKIGSGFRLPPRSSPPSVYSNEGKCCFPLGFFSSNPALNTFLSQFRLTINFLNRHSCCCCPI